MDRNSRSAIGASAATLSPSSRRAWIEIYGYGFARGVYEVALLAEGVDRNTKPLRKEHLDGVALLAEGVDRNMLDAVIDEDAERSPSSRRAWIEISRSWDASSTT